MAKTHAVPDSMKLGWIAERLPFKALQWLPASTTALHPPAPNGVPMDDWNVLLRAIKDRLHRSAADPAAVARPHVLDCVTALGQLQMALQQEVGRRQRLEHQLLEAKTALAQTRAQLHGTQA
jgi:hypothetical protein